VRNLNKQFGELIATDNLSFEVEEKEILGIAGPNGAGKTTLFNLITGILTGEGEILYKDKNIHGLPPYKICRMGITRTFQIPTLFNTLTVYENLLIGGYFGHHGSFRLIKEDSYAKEALKFIGLESKAEVEARTLNLYEKKLTMMGACIATHPEILLLDEPMGGLNPAEMKKFVDKINKINKNLGVTVIIIEHLMKVLVTFVDRLMIIHEGKEICNGLPEKVIKDNEVKEVYLGMDYA